MSIKTLRHLDIYAGSVAAWKQMRTTLDIDEDVLCLAKDLARDSGQSLGRALSELARRSLHRETAPTTMRNGVPLLSVLPNSRPVTSQIIADLLEMDE